MKLPIQPEMNCRRVSDLLSQYADGDLPATRRAQVQAHLDGCAQCATRLQTLRQAVSFLEADAKLPSPAMPDLYAGFRERLVTQPSGSSPLARRAQRAGGVWHMIRMGMAGISLVAAGSVSIVWHRRVSVLNEAIQSLQLPNNNPTFLREVAQNSEAYVSHGNSQSDSIWKDGYRWSSATISNSKQILRQTGLTTPGGVILVWQTPLNNAKMPPVIHLYWNPADPLHPQNTDLQFTFGMFRHWLKQLSHSNKMLFADVETAQETIGGERMNKLTIRRLNTTIGAKPVSNGEYSEPNTLVLWFDANKRLRQYREEFRSYTGGERSEQETIAYDAYDQNPPFDIANSPLPKGWPVVVALSSPPRTIPAADIVNPLWRTMPASEKQELQGVADRFAQVWASQDTAQLRSLVDLTRPLEVTFPKERNLVKTRTIPGSSPPLQAIVPKAKELTVEDIWQRVWAERLTKEPVRSDYHITLTYVYDAANKPLLDRVPLTIPTGQTYVSMPGVNALAWVSEKDAEGRQTGYAARLFLVKRNGEWKVWQFAREAASPNTGGWDNDE
jgi:hypothetical protein